MSYITAIAGFLKVAWPIVSMILGALSLAHGNASRVEAKSGAMSIESQAVHVLGAGGLGAGLLLAGATGVGMNHVRTSNAPSKPAPGVDPIAHELAVLHTILVENGGKPDEFDKLKEMVVGRVVQTQTEAKS